MMEDKLSNAIDRFIDEVALIAGNEPLDGDETEKITKEIGRRLDKFFANEPSEKFALVYWTVDDIYEEADAHGIEINEEEAKALIDEIEESLKEEMIKAGWHLISEVLKDRQLHQ